MHSSSSSLRLIGRMKVEQFAALAGLGIEELVEVVLGSTPARAPKPIRGSSPRPAGALAAAPPSPADPQLAALFGRVTYNELHRALDRWMIDRVLEEHRGNVSRAAARLGITRRTVRRHRALADRLDQSQTVTPSTIASAIPTPPAVVAILAHGGDRRRIRDAVDRWLLGATLACAQGNINRAARSLGMTRKSLRVRWNHVRG
ncbi:helix-turn-helix domain-containing protein [Paraliomyxa miuraensis]|uniref:helix-turn-helix domain-containing protein n=1 Tax=Paraliomyxa miuraensis TaxID=376150 RepID=UPI00224E1062|nr:helix-turn-helix domain-containing protein [Paraliomyxa miuraensis]MCX4239224.1 hypothetical protein [Paraliomyxa miuraensis]